MPTFDYIIVGGGSAGAVIASRLSEDSGLSVLLLEAGGKTHKHPFIRMPIGFLKAYQQKQFSTRYEGEPEPALNGRRMENFRGRALGGSSTVNGMMYNRGNRLDYDFWRQRGLDGWGYADVLPYFKRLETSWRGEGKYHGGSGPIGVKQINDPTLLYEDFEAAAIRAGHAPSSDLFGEQTEGVGRLELSVGGGERSSTARCYLDPAMGRPNLTIITQAATSGIILDQGRAIGVRYRRGGEDFEVRAAREVILSAGSFGSPQLLMLSGIGPADHLREVGITPVVDLPGVGQNLQEHPLIPLMWKANRTDTFLNNLRLDRAARHAAQWLLNKTGPFTTTACHGIVFAKSQPQMARPDVYLAGTAVGLDADLWFPGLTRPPSHRFVSILSVNHPESRGWLKLGSANPADKPRILYNLLSHKQDVASLVAGVKMARDIYGQQPQAGAIDHEILPGSAVQTDAEIEAYLREIARLGEHPLGTCAMGVGSDAVVDASLRVYGVLGLRVADASIMPDEPGGNINIPTIMIGEKAADLIRGVSLPRAEL